MRRWQRVQWHQLAETSGASISNRTAPQRHPPVRGSSGIAPASLGAAGEQSRVPRIEASSSSTGCAAGDRTARAAQRRRHLEQAARVRARVDVRLGREHVRRLAVAERPRRVGLDEVVDAGAAAAHLLLGRLDELEPGIERSIARGSARTRWAWPRWHASW